ncbi:calcium-activated potassium channel subunit alpha [Plasmopara halstedii]|uniref:Calcium-activated potassium channel subunit alpha n=1 Tax=Plasmopara halstedii TaxID=4781 RepID=A0A0N7L6F6_PLAHL|nr:calcium-activated potassium channel subunit alpha [Plasmopara halstedii]CEG44139.1 calcium-activated potassium channel subunit alpha [Plasmopara halstedii]|eukprot:XP_024580508.1 calcium-activated potassium channel subunit alpha [Plasmopara halstedii]
MHQNYNRNTNKTATFMDPLSFDEAVIVVLHAYDCTTMKGHMHGLHQRLLRNYDLIWNQVELRTTMAISSTFQAVFHVSLNWTGLRIGLESWMQEVDFSLNLIFTLEYLVHAYAAFDRLEYILSFFPIVEFAVVLPSWFDLISTHTPSIGYADTLPYVSRLLRPLRFIRIFRLVQFATSSLQQQAWAAMLTIVSIVFTTAGVVQATEACLEHCDDEARVCRCRDLSFPNLLYFVVVSISTLGYGDISPVSISGKFVIAFVILFTFIVVPIQVNRIQATITSHTDYSSAYSAAKLHPHVILTGFVNADSLSVFFGEFFHPSNLNWNERVVILNAAPPTPEINKVLHAYDSKAQYIVGSPMLDEDLTRAVLSDVSACYVLVNRQSSRPQYADQCCALITIALRRGNPTCPIYAQIINSRNAATLLKMGASDVVVVGMLKFSILGRSCQVNGLPTLLLNLLAQCNSDLDSHHSSPQWQRHYLHGYMHGIFLLDIPRTFSSLTFGDLIRFLYDKASIIPLAMLTDDGVRFIDMDFKLGATADPNLCCKVYVIAKGLSAVEGVVKIPPEQILSYRKGVRRKGKSSSSSNLMEMKKIKPALGDEIEQIRESIINMYSVAEDYDVEAAMGLADSEAYGYSGHSHGRLMGEMSEYERFASLGAPEDITNHIVVCGFPSDTYHFIITIREAPVPDDDNSPSPAIVFLAADCLNEREFERLRGFSDVYFVQGSPVNFADLKKTNIRSAISVLILTQASEAQYSDPNMVDADAITIVRYIVEISQRTRMPNLVVELDKSSNVKLLSSQANERRTTSAYGMPAPVNRNVSYLSTRRESVNSVLSRRDSFWTSLDEGDGNTDASFLLEEFIASGRVFMNSMLDSLMSECYRKPWITQFLHLLINGSTNDLEERRLFQIEAPNKLIARTYGECFRLFLDMASCTIIGLWRPERGVALPHPCVFTNPPTDLQIEVGDLFFVVGKPFAFTSSPNIFTS